MPRISDSLATRRGINSTLPGILIVEPHADTRLLYAAALAPLGAVITEAEDGAEAIGKAVCDPPTVVITETTLGRLDGFGLCTSLRRDPLTADITIIVATAAASDGAETRALAAGANEVLLKPYPIEHLITTVRAALLRQLEGQRCEEY